MTEEELTPVPNGAGEEEPAPAQEPASAEIPPVPEPDADRQAAFGRQIREELRAIRQYEPDIETPADLLKLDRREALLDEVKNHNHTLWEAYRFVYADRIAGARLREEERRSRESRQSKAHLRPAGTVGAGETGVPAEVERNIRAILPRATKQEIREFYRRDSKKFG